MLDREADLEALERLLRGAVCVTIWGVEGLGKRTLAHALTERLRLASPGGVHEGERPPVGEAAVLLLPDAQPIDAELVVALERGGHRAISTTTGPPIVGVGHALSALALPDPLEPMSSAAGGRLFVAHARARCPDFDPVLERATWQLLLDATRGVPARIVDAAEHAVTVGSSTAPWRRDATITVDGAEPMLRFVAAFEGGAPARAVVERDETAADALALWHRCRDAGLLIPAPLRPGARSVLSPRLALEPGVSERADMLGWLSQQARGYVLAPSATGWRWLEEEARNLSAAVEAGLDAGGPGVVHAAWCAVGVSVAWAHRELLHPTAEQVDALLARVPAESALAYLRARLFCLAAEHARHRGDLEEAERCAHAAEHDAPAEACLELAVVTHMRGELGQARDRFRVVFDTATADTPTAIHAAHGLGMVLGDLDDVRGAEQAFDAALARAQRSRSASHVALTHYYRGSFHEQRREYAEAIGHLRTAIDGLHRTNNREYLGFALVRLAQARVGNGELEEARGALREAEDGLTEGSGHLLRGLIAGWRGVVGLIDRRPEDALPSLREAVAAFERARHRRFQAWFGGFLATAEVTLGRRAQARETLARARVAVAGLDSDGIRDALDEHAVALEGRRIERSEQERTHVGARRWRSDELVAELLPRILSEATRVIGLRVVGDASAFGMEGQELVSLEERPVMRRLLRVLLERRLRTPGHPIAAIDLVEATWPDERARHDAAMNRLYNVVNGLRRLGLRDVLRHDGDGYLLDPEIPVSMEPAPISRE